jgi:hypothetical protein
MCKLNFNVEDRNNTVVVWTYRGNRTYKAERSNFWIASLAGPVQNSHLN